MEKAVETYQQIVNLEPDNPVGYGDLGAAYLSMGKYEETIGAFQKSLAIKPTADVYSNLGTVYFYLKKYPEAVAMFQKAVDKHPDDEGNSGHLADVSRLAGDSAQAAATYQNAITLGYQELNV